MYCLLIPAAIISLAAISFAVRLKPAQTFLYRKTIDTTHEQVLVAERPLNGLQIGTLALI